ncbi:MAG: right-handed parallel beta-helix repeat-containing protein, partial [Armatimonadota bacterium]|nr:right-handed parallel beta-helix repeat-containing protein [Armatimonadota bacterium]
KRLIPFFVVVLHLSAGLCERARAADGCTPVGSPQLEAPTLHSLGVWWVVRGDDNANAVIALAYRKAGTTVWRAGRPLFRVEKGAHQPEKYPSKVEVPPDGWLFAGSALLLDPDTEYELRLTLQDPDGGSTEQLLRARTNAEPRLLSGAARFHVVPGRGGGSGTAADPFRGLAAAQERARPGDVFLLHAGVYGGTFEVTRSGEPGRPIVWRAAGDGEAVIDGSVGAERRPGRAISASDVHDVWFEGLTVRNADYGLVGHRSSRVVVRRCHIHGVDYGITFTNNDRDNCTGWFISDNLIEGPSTWPRTRGIENARGIQATGTGHDVCYNRIRGFADAIDTFGSPRCAAIDFHHNEISEMTDDGIEMDYSERNTRCFYNRLTNVYQGISVQPIFGGPVYIFRNALYNVVVETFKMHNSPSGALMFHNTSVKQGMPLVLYTSEKVRNSVYRNNLFVGTAANYAYETTAPMEGCDFDYDGFAGGPWRNFLSWNRARYATLDEVKVRAGVYRHAVLVEQIPFASGVRPPEDPTRQYPTAINDLRLKPASAAVDAGQPLPGINDGFAGKAPDLGAYELGAPLPHYGPRDEAASGG